MSVSAHSYRNIENEGRPTETPPALKALAEAALAVLARDGEKTEGSGWRYGTKTADGMDFAIRCTGPDLPASVPEATISPADIPKDPQWKGTHRLVVAPPLVAFDITWTPGEPLRIMTFSRGDWEAQLARLAGMEIGAS